MAAFYPNGKPDIVYDVPAAIVTSTDTIELSSVWTYFRKDPIAAHVEFGGPHPSVRWSFGRNLLLEILSEDYTADTITGLGDVEFIADSNSVDTLQMNLSSLSGKVQIMMPRQRLERFAYLSMSLVPVQRESDYAMQEIDRGQFWKIKE